MKRRKYEGSLPANTVLIPFAIDATGGFGDAAKELMKALGKHMNEHFGHLKKRGVVTEMKQRISLELARFNGRMLAERQTTPDSAMDSLDHVAVIERVGSKIANARRKVALRDRVVETGVPETERPHEEEKKSDDRQPHEPDRPQRKMKPPMRNPGTADCLSTLRLTTSALRGTPTTVELTKPRGSAQDVERDDLMKRGIRTEEDKENEKMESTEVARANKVQFAAPIESVISRVTSSVCDSYAAKSAVLREKGTNESKVFLFTRRK